MNPAPTWAERKVSEEKAITPKQKKKKKKPDYGLQTQG